MSAKLRSFGQVIAVGILVGPLAVAQEAIPTAEQNATLAVSEVPLQKETSESTVAAIPVVVGTCTLTPSSGEFEAVQAENKGRLLSFKFGSCRFERTTDGLNALSLEVRLQFEPTASLSHCSAMSVAFLFEIAATTPGFNWGGSREVVVDLPLKNHSGNDQNVSMFRFHSGTTQSTYTIDQVLPARPDVPNFDHIYWGNLILLKAPRTSEFAAEMARNTPIVGQGGGKVDYTLALAVRIAQPRGWCWFQETDPAGVTISKKANLTFVSIP